MRRALLNIYSKDFHPDNDIEINLFNEIWALFNKAARRGFSESAAPDPDEDFRAAITRNNAVFSAFKVHRMQNDMAPLFERQFEAVRTVAEGSHAYRFTPVRYMAAYRI